MGEIQAASYIAECFWPDVRPEQVDEAAVRAGRSAAELTRAGIPVGFTGSILISSDDVVFYLFDGVSPEAVRAACERAAIPFERIVESVQKPARTELL